MKSNGKQTVSVCVMTYNHERYIKDCLLSVLAQSYDVSLEVLVGDDASSDGTTAIVRGIAQRFPEVTLFRHEPNLGPAENLQFLVRHAKGEYLAHLDGDDYWMPGKLERQLAFLQEHPECAAVYCNAAVIGDTGEMVGAFDGARPETIDLNYLVGSGNFLNHSSLLYRREHREEVLDIPAPFLDYQIHLRLARRGRLGFLDQALVVYRRGSVTSMVRTMPQLVKSLYWKALLDLPPAAVGSKALIFGMADFLHHIFFMAMRFGHVRWALAWGRQVREEAPAFARSIILLALLKSLRRLVQGIATKPFRSLFGNRLERLH